MIEYGLWIHYRVDPLTWVLLGAVYALTVRLAVDAVIRRINRRRKQ